MFSYQRSPCFIPFTSNARCGLTGTSTQKLGFPKNVFCHSGYETECEIIQIWVLLANAAITLSRQRILYWMKIELEYYTVNIMSTKMSCLGMYLTTAINFRWNLNLFLIDERRGVFILFFGNTHTVCKLYSTCSHN